MTNQKKAEKAIMKSANNHLQKCIKQHTQASKDKTSKSWSNDLNISTEFENEKEYQEFVELNIDKVCEEVLNLGQYVSHQSNWSIGKSNFGKTMQRVDLYIVGENKKALVELKYPKNYFCEMRNAISQLLFYSTVADSCGVEYDKLCLISPVYDNRIFPMISKYNLPIEMYYLTKQFHSLITLNA